MFILRTQRVSDCHLNALAVKIKKKKKPLILCSLDIMRDRVALVRSLNLEPNSSPIVRCVALGKCNLGRS